MIDYATFRRIFDSSFWKTISESLVPFDKDEKPSNKDEFLKQLYADIQAWDYSPSVPREFIVYNKHNSVPRFVPTFSYRDICVYFFCVKRLEDEIAINRVEGTFGGWRLGNPIRKLEEEEIFWGLYIPSVSFDRFAWGKNWKEFQKKAYEYSLLDNYKYFLKFDIANFYDSINLNLLENKIRLVVDKDKRFTIELLFNFLGNWNKRFEGYSRKTVGIPQDEVGDCSRILANFYLQDYDAFIYRLCQEKGARYLRYADDQIIYAESESIAEGILIEAAKEQLKSNLNINSSKVTAFTSPEDFNTYWAFDLFNLLENPNDKENVNKAALLYLKWKEEKRFLKEESVLKRLLGIDFSLFFPEVRYKLLANVHDPKFLAVADFWYFNRIFQNASNKEEFFVLLDSLIDTVRFNFFHYNLLKFNKKTRPECSNDKLLAKIKELKFQSTYMF